MKIPELLAPAGSFEAAKSAVLAGADAIYMGGQVLNARMNAKNFSNNQLVEAVEFCHQNGVKVYVTVNVAVYDKELVSAVEYIDFLYDTGVDALIVSDLAIAKIVHSRYPDFELHASTQASGHNAACATEFARLGFSRMVAARELSRAEIADLVAKSPIETEIFVHGAMCVSQSGQCLASAMIGGRSGNRGACAQPCRMKYNGGYPLSLKDMCLAQNIVEIIDTGVDCLKIEGRMRSPIYVGVVTAIYRKLLDERRNATDSEMDILRKVFSRSGFTNGYFSGEINAEMCGVRSEEDINLSRNFDNFVTFKGKEQPKIEAKNRTVSREAYSLERPSKKPQKVSKPVYTARFCDPRQVFGEDFFAISYLPLDKFEGGVCDGVLLPPTIFPRDEARALKLLERARSLGAKHALVCNIGQVELAKNFGFILHGDFRLNVFNSVSAQFYGSLSMRDLIVSPELTLPQIRDISAPVSAIVYGKVPIMLLTKPISDTILNDRIDAKFEVVSEFGYSELLNSVPFWMGDKQKLLDDYFVRGRHFLFTTESPAECRAVLKDYTNFATRVGNIRRIAGKN